jgi:hypothetical protein
MHLPSAGMIRFRFNGSALLHLSPFRHPEVMTNIAPLSPGARAFQAARLPTSRSSPASKALFDLS